MKRTLGDLFARLAGAGVFIVLGVALCWRAFSYSATNPSMLGPALCVLLALVLVMTGATLALRGGELDYGSEQSPAGQID